MSVSINGSSSSERISELEYLQSDSKNIIVQEEKRNVQSVTDLAKKDGMLSLMMEKQSLRTDTAYATSAAQKRTETDSSTKSVNLSVAGEGDANKAERLAATVSGVLTSQINITQPNNKPAESSKSDSQSTVTRTSSASAQSRSQPAVEGGTDITAADTVSPRFINVVGSMKQLEVSNTITTVMLNAERDANKAAAAATNRSVDAAARAGDKTIAAARQNLSGSITSAGLGIAGQGASTANQMKALNKESASITTNLKSARNLESGVRENQSVSKSVKETTVDQNKKLSADVEASVSQPQASDTHTSAVKRDNLVDQNKKLSADAETEATVSQPQASDIHTSAVLRDNHNAVQIATQKTRVTAEYASQGIRSAQGAVEGGFGVAAAGEQKEAELARADRDVNNELASTQSQTAKKAAETNQAIRSLTEAVLNSNSSAVSSIAERTR